MSTQEIWYQFHDRLFAFVLDKVKSEELAKDIIQDVFEKIHLNIGQLKEEDKLTSWVFQITRNTMIDHLRRAQRFVSQQATIIDAEEESDERSFNHCLMGMIDSLDDKYREAIIEVDVNGVSQKELADRLNLSHSAIKSRVQRARHEVKKGLEACCQMVTDGYGHPITDKE